MPRNLRGVTSLVCLCVLVGITSSVVDLGSLVQINVLFRHGTRTPFEAPYPTSSWPKSTLLMELTQAGMMETYNLGKTIKDRYISGNPYNILSSKYESTRILVNSSMNSRTLESAYTFLAGMYPPEGDQIWNPGLPWQPIPVYARDPWDEPACNVQSEDTCPTLTKLHEHERAKYEHQINADNKEFFAYLDEKTGNEPGTTDLTYAYFIHDSLVMERGEGKLPKWANEMRPNKMTVFEQLANLSAIVYRSRFLNGDLKKIVGGKLLENVTRNMQNVNGTKIKAFVYAVHEDNMGPALSCLGIRFEDLSEYINPATVAIFELYNNLGQYNVRLAYKDGLADSFRYLDIPGCGSNDSCPLKSFELVGEHCFLADWRATCGLTPSPAKSTSISASSAGMMAGIVGSILLLCIVLSAIIIFVAVFGKKKNPLSSSDDKYQSIN